jgi:hypothetical protein
MCRAEGGELVAEQLGVVDDSAFEHPVKLLAVDGTRDAELLR